MMSTDQLTPAITLPSTQATHVVGETSMPLAEGDLCLYITPPAKDVNPSHEGLVEEEESTVDHFGGGVGNEQADEQILTLTVGKAAFPLFRSTMFGTMDGDERVYLFQPKLGEVGGYVKIILPEDVKDETSMVSDLQEEFERILINHGLLKEGIDAAADELGRSVSQESKAAAQQFRKQTSDYLHSYPPILATSQPTLESSASTTQTFFSAAQKVSSAVGTVASSAGTWVSSQLSSTSPTDSAPPAPPPKEYPHSSRHPESGPGISTGNASDRSPETYTTDSTLVFATSENVPTPAQSDSGGDVEGAGRSKDVTTEHPKDTEEDEEEDEDIGEENLVVEMEREGSGHWEEVTV